MTSHKSSRPPFELTTGEWRHFATHAAAGIHRHEGAAAIEQSFDEWLAHEKVAERDRLIKALEDIEMLRPDIFGLGPHRAWPAYKDAVLAIVKEAKR